MNSTVDIPAIQRTDAETFDVIIIGAGPLASAPQCAATRLPRPGSSARAPRGDWRYMDLFRYPGIRSDSDMHTLGYDFKPWEAEKSIADGPSILSYVNETADEYRIRERIRFSQKLITADWCSERGQWELTVDTPDGVRRYRCGFLICVLAITATIKVTNLSSKAEPALPGIGCTHSSGLKISITLVRKSW